MYVWDHIRGANGRKFKNVQSSHRSTYGNVYARTTLTFICNILYIDAIPTEQLL